MTLGSDEIEITHRDTHGDNDPSPLRKNDKVQLEGSIYKIKVASADGIKLTLDRPFELESPAGVRPEPQPACSACSVCSTCALRARAHSTGCIWEHFGGFNLVASLPVSFPSTICTRVRLTPGTCRPTGATSTRGWLWHGRSVGVPRAALR